MPEKSPENIALLTYAWMLGVAIMGGIASYLKKYSRSRKWSVIDLLVEVFTSAFVGLITFFICTWAGIDQIGSAAMTGIAGHFSSTALAQFKKLLKKVLGGV